MYRKLIGLTAIVAVATAAFASEYHVAVTGDDGNPGTKARPFRTISAAASVAQPGDTVTVHEGTYRERVSPPRGGLSDSKRITYQAAPGERVIITGSEPVKGWEKVSADTWKVVIPNTFFGGFNPYADLIHGDWFDGRGRQHHTGCVYLDGEWLTEAAGPLNEALAPAGQTPLWFAQVDSAGGGEPGNTTIWAQFPGVNPNEANVEINVRQTVFTPEKTGVNYITVRGFILRNAATNWAPPTAGQIGLVSAYWCKGWIIEANDIGYSKCSGVALGKYSDEWDNRAESAEGYVGTLTRALSNGWNKATVGGHLVRNNHIHHCEQTGVVGSLGCSFSTVTGNDIHDIHVRDLFSGAEMAGIKFHGAIDVVIRDNHVYRCGPIGGIWLDWMGQGAQVAGNLLHDNHGADIFCEMQHGPLLIANNLFLSRAHSLEFNSQGMAVVHNLISGEIVSYRSDTRATPFHKAHTTELAGMHADSASNDSGDHRFYNNLFIAPCRLSALNDSAWPCFAAGNVFTKGTGPSKFDTAALVKPDFDPGVKLAKRPDGWYLTLSEDRAWPGEQKRRLVTTELLGNARIPNLPYENPDGSPLRVVTDYFGKQRDTGNPFPGPFEIVKAGPQTIKVWPKAD
jgi:alpha-L-arabinofuranosidase